MRRFVTRHRFSQWDGSQMLAHSADDALGAMVDDLMEYGDLRWAMRNLFSRGMDIPGGDRLQGMREMLKTLRERKKERLSQFDLSSVMDDIGRKLDEIIGMERSRIDEWKGGGNTDAGEGSEGSEGGESSESSDTAGKEADKADKADDFTDDLLRQIAEKNAGELDNLPEDPAGKMNALQKYEFLDPEAQKKYLELLNQLRKAMTQSFFNNIEQMVKNMSDGDVKRMKDMLRALNEMLARRAAGDDPEFDRFMDEFGDMFGPNPPKDLDELLEQMRQQMAAAQSLLNSLSPEQRSQLGQLMAGRFDDPELEFEMQQLANALDFLNPRGQRYNFGGTEDIDLEAAMRLMDEMHQLDELISQVQAAERGGDPDRIDMDLLKELLGDEAADSLDELKKLLKALEEAGYIRPTGENRWELTPRGSRMIGQKALGEIYARLKRQSLGNHAVPEEGPFGETQEQAKPWEYGEPFHLHLPRTVRNAIDRNGPATPVQLEPDDFEIHRSELITSTSTAMLVDLSWSMALRGSFQAAKKVALALHNLITSQYPKDSFHIIGFAAYARELKAHDLPFLQWDEYVLGTNMQHALLLAERLLAKHSAGAKQIIMISDGEPTAHLENGQARFAYPPTAATIRATMRAVKRCSQKGIAINTFMLDASYYLKAFMDQIARINGGRVFYTTPDKLGEYILVDYVQHKRKRLGR